MPAPAIKKESPFWQLPVTALLEQLATTPRRTEQRGGGSPPGPFRPQPDPWGAQTGADPAISRQVPEPPGHHPPRRQRPLRLHRRRRQLLHHRHHRPHQCDPRFRPGIPGRTGGGSSAPVGGGARPGAAGRQAPGNTARGNGAGRCGAPGRRRPGSLRRPGAGGKGLLRQPGASDRRSLSRWRNPR